MEVWRHTVAGLPVGRPRLVRLPCADTCTRSFAGLNAVIMIVACIVQSRMLLQVSRFRATATSAEGGDAANPLPSAGNERCRWASRQCELESKRAADQEGTDGLFAAQRHCHERRPLAVYDRIRLRVRGRPVCHDAHLSHREPPFSPASVSLTDKSKSTRTSLATSTLSSSPMAHSTLSSPRSSSGRRSRRRRGALA